MDGIKEKDSLLKALADEHVKAGRGAAELVRAIRDNGIISKYREAYDVASRELRAAYMSARDDGLSPSFEELVVEFLESGKSVSDFAIALVDRGFYDDSDEARKVAQLEMRFRRSIATQKSIMQNEAVNRKRWMYSGDYRNNSEHCRNHASMDGQIVPKGEPFTLTGLDGKEYYPMHPHDESLPKEEREGCRCIHQGITDSFELIEETRQKIQAETSVEEEERWLWELDSKSRARAGAPILTFEEWKAGREEQAEARDGYELLGDMNALLDELEREFSADLERRTFELADTVAEIKGLSGYQVALAIKRLADCCYSYGQRDKALAQYVRSLNFNPKLPVKRRIKELESQGN